MTHGEGRWEAVWTRNLTVFKHITGTLPFFTDFETDFKTWLVFIFFFSWAEGASFKTGASAWSTFCENNFLRDDPAKWQPRSLPSTENYSQGCFSLITVTLWRFQTSAEMEGELIFRKHHFSENNHPSKSFIGLNDFQCMWNQPTPEREAVMKEQNNVSR